MTASRRREGVLVRIPVSEGHWAESIPPVPSGFDVTVSFSDEALTHEHGDALLLLGYRVVAGPGQPVAVPPAADFLIGNELIGQHPTYYRSLADQARRAYNLAFGPAAALVEDVVDAHTRIASS